MWSRYTDPGHAGSSDSEPRSPRFLQYWEEKNRSRRVVFILTLIKIRISARPIIFADFSGLDHDLVKKQEDLWRGNPVGDEFSVVDRRRCLRGFKLALVATRERRGCLAG